MTTYIFYRLKEIKKEQELRYKWDKIDTRKLRIPDSIRIEQVCVRAVLEY